MTAGGYASKDLCALLEPPTSRVIRENSELDLGDASMSYGCATRFMRRMRVRIADVQAAQDAQARTSVHSCEALRAENARLH